MSIYMFYEHQQINNKDFTSFIFSSSRYRVRTVFTNINYDTITAHVALIKQISSNLRHYDKATKIWTIPTVNFNSILFRSMFFDLVPIIDLMDFVNGSKSEEKNTKPIDPNDFFYTPEQPLNNTTTNTVENTEKQLFKILSLALETDSSVISGCSSVDLNKLYRKAAIKLHPDFNNGDGSRMSELNQVWQQYKNFKGV